MIFLIAILFLLAGLMAVAMNRDLFSPGKLFLVYFAIFYAGILTTDVSALTTLLVALVLFTGVVAIAVEGLTASRLPPLNAAGARPITNNAINFEPILWLMSAPPIAAQLFMISHFGGLDSYINSIAYRVVEWRGFGWARILIALLLPLNLAYFALGLMRAQSARRWALYLIHFSILLLIGTLSGSRSGILSIFVLQAIIYHYLRRPIAWQIALGLASSLVFAAAVLGLVREGVRAESGRVSINETVADRDISFKSFNHGVEPLELIATSGDMPLAYGTTFLSVFTNAVPRNFWPDKPDTGGVFFTKNYAGDQWAGYSNLTPSFLGEWLINFGWIFGVLGFAAVFTTILIVLGRYYFRIRHRVSSNRSDLMAIDVVIYIQTVLMVMGLMPGETTNVIINFVISQLAPLLLVRGLIQHAQHRHAVRSGLIGMAVNTPH